MVKFAEIPSQKKIGRSDPNPTSATPNSPSNHPQSLETFPQHGIKNRRNQYPQGSQESESSKKKWGEGKELPIAPREMKINRSKKTLLLRKTSYGERGKKLHSD